MIRSRRRRLSRGSKKVMLVAGGTAGHIMAALAVSDALIARGMALDDLSFLTANRDLDIELLPAAIYDVVRYQGRGLTRGGTSITRVEEFISTTISSSLAILGPIRRWRPAVVVTFGGFYSLVGSLWAKTLGAKVVVVEQNVVLGRANALVSYLADQVLLAFDETKLPGRIKGCSEIVGNPVRPDVVELANAYSGPRMSAREQLGVCRNELILVITSGSLGARVLNASVAGLLKMVDLELTRRNKDEKVRIVHFQGGKNRVEVDANLTLNGIDYEARDFDPRLYLWLAAADVVISRAGTSTLFELFALGVAAIYVPLPNAPKNHQELNAMYAKRRGAAEVVFEGDGFEERLAFSLNGILFDSRKREEMAKSASTCASLDAAQRVADVVFKWESY